jgi:hypothetical protein
MATVRIENLSKSFSSRGGGTIPVLDKVSINAAHAEFIACSARPAAESRPC